MWHTDMVWGIGSGQGWPCSGDEMVAGADDREKKACSYQLPLKAGLTSGRGHIPSGCAGNGKVLAGVLLGKTPEVTHLHTHQYSQRGLRWTEGPVLVPG